MIIIFFYFCSLAADYAFHEIYGQRECETTGCLWGDSSDTNLHGCDCMDDNQNECCYSSYQFETKGQSECLNHDKCFGNV